MKLSSDQLRAIRALERITMGEECFLNISDADQLVELGLADRFGKGQFVLTEAGRQLLRQKVLELHE